MSATGNYRGILVDSGQYRTISNLIEFKHVIHFNPPKDANSLAVFLDRIWFRIGHRSIPTFVVSAKPHSILTDLCNAGLLYDMRGITIPSSEGGTILLVYDLMHEIISGKATFISKCNEIRDMLASRPRIRWCGAELESIFCRNVYHNATEICGNATLGFFCSPISGATGVMPRPMNETHLRDFYISTIEEFDDDGQRKLGLIMYAVPRMGYNLIYVGGSPGNAWLRTLVRREFAGVIVTIDPSPLSSTINIVGKVVEIRAMVTFAEDILALLGREGLEDLRDIIFIWDVRHADANTMDENSRANCIAMEVVLLNEICNSLWFWNNVKIYQLKMNSNNLDLYEMPSNACIFAQPFTLTRDVYELRITGHIDAPDYPLTTLSAEMQVAVREYSHELKEKISNGQISDYDLFINFICSIYRRCDYIDSPPLVRPDWEIALFTLNWNLDAKLARYFDRIYNSEIKFIGSFFTKPRLTDEEHVFPEHLLLLRYPSMVFDSRALIDAKLEGLYFFANTVNCQCMDNELIFSESYLIGSTEYNLHSIGKMSQYDEVRTIECTRANAVFPKFPNTFSASENIMSPSGHALRMFIEYTRDCASLCMFAHKILSNFYRTGQSRIRKEYADTFFPNSETSWLNAIGPKFIPKKNRLERADDTIWHSKEEWIVGYSSGYRISQCSFEALGEIINFLKRTIDCDLKGIEIFAYRQQGWQQVAVSTLRMPKLIPQANMRDPYILKISHIYEGLKKMNVLDYAKWLTLPNCDSKTLLWKRAVFALSLDKYARECLIHSAYTSTLDPLATLH